MIQPRGVERASESIRDQHQTADRHKPTQLEKGITSTRPGHLRNKQLHGGAGTRTAVGNNSGTGGGVRPSQGEQELVLPRESCLGSSSVPHACALTPSLHAYSIKRRCAHDRESGSRDGHRAAAQLPAAAPSRGAGAGHVLLPKPGTQGHCGRTSTSSATCARLALPRGWPRTCVC